MKRLIVITLALVMLLASMTMAASAAETVSINGYDFEEKGQFTISNVTNKSIPNKDGIITYHVQDSTTVTLTAENIVQFYVSTMKQDADGYYVPDKELIADGYTEETWNSFLMEIEPYAHKTGTKFTIEEPGVYFARARFEALAGAADAIIVVEKVKPAEVVTAVPTSSKVVVNGEVIAFDAYNINGNNYFKLRDIATVVRGSEKQFEVTYDAAKKAINLVSGQPYTTIGGEMAAGDGTAKIGTLNKAAIYNDGEVVELTAYNINGNNYFKLRDLGETFDFGVSWDSASKAVMIDTSTEYVPE